MATLVTADQLAASLAAGEPLTVLDVRYWLGHPGRGRAAHLEGHIPGAAFVDLDTDLDRKSVV